MTNDLQARLDAALKRLDRLEDFLTQDPANAALRAEAFQVALQAREWERARRHLELAGERDGPAWKMREAHLYMAQHRFAEARELLTGLALIARDSVELAQAAAHDLAHIDFSEG